MITFAGCVGCVLNVAMFAAIVVGLSWWVISNAKTRAASPMPRSYRILYLFNDAGLALLVILTVGWVLYNLIVQGVLI